MAENRFKNRLAESLSGPRVYSTDFHPRSLEGERTAEHDALTIRSLKVKLLTKGVVTINGGHLLHPAAISLLRQHEALLTQELVLPAIREDKGSFEAYVPDYEEYYRQWGWSEKEIAAAVDFVDQRVTTILPWRVEQAQDQYRACLINGLEAPNAAIRKSLIGQGYKDANLEQLVDSISKADLSEDKAIDHLLAAQPLNVRPILSRFANACYHVVGTSVVNCETGLDISALAYHKLGDISGAEVYEQQDLLSDTNIFLRCCFEIAMQAINERAFPATVIDSIPIDTIAKIRLKLQEQGFQDAYDEVLRTFTDRIGGSSDLSTLEEWDPERTVELVNALGGQFRTYFEEEVPGYRKAIQERREEAAIKAGAETVKAIGGLLPGVGTLISIVDLGAAGLGAATAASDAISYRDHAVADAAAHRERDKKVEKALEVLNPSNHAKILTALRQLREISAELQRPN
ncbi:hypothetical protein [Mesorhizobium sp.]|uniref:hypothetical protein n=1 Tax=Mesorhizobium sp. TaxID=1871066 RepID=UPI000FE555D1|nr:hypothetical protein [Mesorhizobium sp.]RWP39796.1 MAG: hypothetical protein EOR05_33830 [Mesorhizobium sp.]